MGGILIAVNPWKELAFYGEETMAQVKTSPALRPHIYSVAHLAYNQLTSSHTAQSILISGESGSGKTESGCGFLFLRISLPLSLHLWRL